LPARIHLHSLFLLLLAAVSACSAQTSAALRPLPNHLPQWANPANSIGLVPANQQFEHLTVVLARSPEQEQALEQFEADLQNPASPSYHQWLTPAEFGERFGASQQDVDAVSAWLRAQGLRINWVSPSRTFIGFAGSAADLGRALQTELRNYRVNGVEYFSVASDPMLPAAIAPNVKAIRGLYSIDERPAHQLSVQSSDSPQLTANGGASHYITPGDFSVLYDVPSSFTGSGVTIGIVGRSRTDFADFANLRSRTGIGFPNPTEIVPTAFGGIDPGPALTAPPSSGASFGDQGEATLDVMRAGSVAPNAGLLLVVASKASGGIEVDAQYLVQTTPVPAQVMTISFGTCESAAGPSGVAFWDTLFQQAAAEGISSFVSSGDAGASGCDSNFATPPAAPLPNSPNYICSSSYATCAGGTEFSDSSNPANYWSSSNNSNLVSAYGYIPEGAWNEPLNASGAPQAAASGGGVSSIIATPAWQIGTGVPAARTGRYTPDVSFSASGHDGYFACFAAGGGSCVANASGVFYFSAFSGTSAVAPALAGVAALLDQKTGSPQGNLNPGFYATALALPQAFHDVTLATSGLPSCDLNFPSVCNNSIPSSTGLSGGQTGYAITAGYDEVTGLGSLDVLSFLSFYTSRFTPTVTVTPSATTISPTQAMTVAVTVAAPSGAAPPSGSVTLTSGNYSPAAITLVNGRANFPIPAGSLAPQSQFLTVKYTPDSAASTLYNAATGSSTVFVQLFTPTITVKPASSPITTAQPLAVTVAVSGGSGNPPLTGIIYLSGGNYSGSATLINGSSALNIAAGLLPVGTDSLNASYVPDSQSSSIYSNASGSASVTVTATGTYTPAVTVTPAYSWAARAEPLPVTITVTGASGAAVPTGTITITSGSYSSTPIPLVNGAAAMTVPAESLTVGYGALAAVYTPDAASSSLYNSTSGTCPVSVIDPPLAPPIITLFPSASSITTAQPLSVFITLAGNGYSAAATGTVTLSSGSYSSAATPVVVSSVATNSVTITIPAGALPAGSDTLTASYTPDATSSGVFEKASATTTVTVSVAVPAMPAFALAGTGVSIARGATSGNTSTITVTPMDGFTGSVTLSATITASPTGAQYLPTLSFGATSPVSITGTAAGTATLTITTTAASASLAHPAQRGLPWYAAGSTLACLLLFAIPARRRSWRGLLGVLLLLAALSSGLLACGGGGSGGGGGGGISGTTSGNYTITISGVSGTTPASSTILLTVQ
jgi:subtilase family serine protease